MGMRSKPINEEYIEAELAERLAFISQELKATSTQLKFSPYAAVSQRVTEMRQALEEVEREGTALLMVGL